MTTMKKSFYPLLYVLSDIFACAASTILLWALATNLHITGKVNFISLSFFFGVLFICTFVFNLIFSNYYSAWEFVGFDEIIRITSSSFSTMIVMVLLQEFGKRFDFVYIPFTKSMIASTCAFLFLLMTAARCVPRATRWVSVLLTGKEKYKRVIIVGAGATGAYIARRMKENPSENGIPVGFIDNDKEKWNMKVCGVRVYGDLDSISKISLERAANEIIVALHSLPQNDIGNIVKKCTETGLHVRVYQEIEEYGKKPKGEIRDFQIEDLLFRPTVKPDMEDIKEYINGKTVLVTGGAGSIGSELCRQVLKYGCKELYIFDISENGLFDIDAELKKEYEGVYFTKLGSIRDKNRIDEVLGEKHFDIVFHAAAHKHVPMMEINPIEAVKNNIFGTYNLIKSCTEHGVSKFVMISTDKAVHPKNIMGATKRACELMVRSYDGTNGCSMCAVRFGNVLGSNGSVIPTFKKQIAAGGPVTVTHKDITRFFMTIPEAVSLVLCAGKRANGGEIFVLNMEQPIRIYDLAENMIRLSGKVPDKDIKIEIVGLRPGEKLYEELSFDSESVSGTDHSRIYVVNQEEKCEDRIAMYLDRLSSLISRSESPEIIKESVFEFINESIEKNGNDKEKLHAGIKIG